MTPKDKEAQQRAIDASQDFLNRIETNFVFPLVTLLLGVAFLVFLFGVFEYIKGGASDTERTKGQQHMLYGIIGMFVMLSALAILRLAAATFGIEGDAPGLTN